MNEFYVPRTHKGAFSVIAGWVIALVVLGSVITVSLWAAGVIFAPQIGKGEARKQINSGSFRIAAYDHFFDLCAAVQGQEAALDAQYTERTTATGDDLQRVQANIAGISAQRGRSIAQYNADARKSYTVGQFRASDLPYQLSTTAYTAGGGKTECVA